MCNFFKPKTTLNEFTEIDYNIPCTVFTLEHFTIVSRDISRVSFEVCCITCFRGIIFKHLLVWLNKMALDQHFC
jgi:hypothetical protein